jgi:hypothetical protein
MNFPPKIIEIIRHTKVFTFPIFSHKEKYNGGCIALRIYIILN